MKSKSDFSSKTKGGFVDKSAGMISKVKGAVGKVFVPPDPFQGLQATGDIEVDSTTELNALQQGFKDRANQETDRFVTATDSEFWFAVCFENREQKELFLQAMGWMPYGDKYLDGTRLAQMQNIPLPKVYLANRNAVRKHDKKLQALTGPDGAE